MGNCIKEVSGSPSVHMWSPQDADPTHEQITALLVAADLEADLVAEVADAEAVMESPFGLAMEQFVVETEEFVAEQDAFVILVAAKLALRAWRHRAGEASWHGSGVEAVYSVDSAGQESALAEEDDLWPAEPDPWEAWAEQWECKYVTKASRLHVDRVNTAHCCRGAREHRALRCEKRSCLG